MRTVWLLVIAMLMAGLAPLGIAEGAPRYDGKPGLKIGEVRVNPKDGAEMVWVPAGEFLMGSTDEQTAAARKRWATEIAKFFIDAEKPQRRVYLGGYWIYKYEVTVAQYRKFCNATKRKMSAPPDWGWVSNHPMVKMNWQDAADYAKWAGVSLPTEAQWEKAARGPNGRIYPWGNQWDPAKCANRSRSTSTQPVGSYASDASPYGARDMAGNAGEWCADWYDPKYYKRAPARNPTGPSAAVKYMGPISGEIRGDRVLRGGTWFNSSPDYFRCAYRSPSYRYRDYQRGFRCATTP